MHVSGHRSRARPFLRGGAPQWGSRSPWVRSRLVWLGPMEGCVSEGGGSPTLRRCPPCGAPRLLGQEWMLPPLMYRRQTPLLAEGPYEISIMDEIYCALICI